ncbi:RNA polymerase sigma-70 factor (ECF subfamily) [Bradyrhizobium diazoefficiens]|uniref:sigma-70 family RNA polymerase sigma factor n=1 Tax=Bradyrhizobium diazoefficiens TaxID=1355477 RepID=UPI003598D0BE
MLTPAELVGLIEVVAKGDQAAFERLYVATRAKLYGVVLRILRRQDLAEEVIQETYVKIWNSAGQFNPALSSPITWMASIARNRAIDIVRKKSEVSIEEEPQAMEVAADSPDPLARREMTEELKRLLECIGRLEPDRSEARASRLLQRLEPRAIGGEIRRARQHGEDVAAAQHVGYPRVPRTMRVYAVRVVLDCK